MGRYSAYKLFFAAVAVFILALPLSSSAYDMQKGMTDADKSVYIEAHEHFSAERYSKAAESVMEHMKNPAVKKHGIFYLLLGNIMTKTGRGQEAYSYYAGAAEFYGDNPDLYVQAGLAAYSNDRTKEAAEMMKKAVELGTENQQAYRVLASSAFDEKRYEEAAEVLRQMKQKETQDYKLLLYIYAVSGDIKSARHLLNHLSRHTVQSKWWKLYGLYMVDRNLEEAAAAFRVYIRTEEPQEKELRMISGVLAGQRVYDEAYELLSRIDDPTCSDRLELGKLALKLGKTEESEQLLKDALEKNVTDVAVFCWRTCITGQPDTVNLLKCLRDTLRDPGTYIWRHLPAIKQEISKKRNSS